MYGTNFTKRTLPTKHLSVIRRNLLPLIFMQKALGACVHGLSSERRSRKASFWESLDQVWLHWRNLYWRISSSFVCRILQNYIPTKRSGRSVEYRTWKCSSLQACDLERIVPSTCWDLSTKSLSSGRWLAANLPKRCENFAGKPMVGASLIDYIPADKRHWPELNIQVDSLWMELWIIGFFSIHCGSLSLIDSKL